MERAENINPAILSWARESAGLSIDEAADRLGLSSNASVTAAEKLAEFEQGDRFPTRIQLLRFSAVYRRPLITFYMKHPPVRGERGEDFRTFSGVVSTRDNALLDALLRDIRARQEMVRSLLEDEEEAVELPFVGSASIRDGVQATVERIARTLEFSVNAVRGRNTNPDDLFRELRNRVEAIGVFVLLIGDLGSHHSSVGEDVFRGFVIADKIAPFIVINDQDAKAARSFTLIHELTHIWLGQSGVSGSPDSVLPHTPIGTIEHFCNDVAGEFLLPSSALAEGPANLKNADKDAASAKVREIAQAWGVSEAMVAYRLNRLGWISGQIYKSLSADYAARWHSIRQKQKEASKESDSGPSYYVVKRHKLGNALVDIVRRTLRDNVLTHTKAAKVLGVKPGTVEPLLRSFEQSRSSLFLDARR